MKLLVFSDSHGNKALMERAVALEQPDMAIHLGDTARDARALGEKFPELPMVCVPGNCDGYMPALPDRRVLELEGKRLLMTHGHIYGVKSGLGAAVYAAREAGADALLFGHTHRALCDLDCGLWILNPGSIQGGLLASYGVIVLENGKMMCYNIPVTQE